MDETERLTEFKEHHWDMLLDYIGQGRVVPVVGPELLVAAEDGRSVPFYQIEKACRESCAQTGQWREAIK